MISGLPDPAPLSAEQIDLPGCSAFQIPDQQSKSHILMQLDQPVYVIRHYDMREAYTQTFSRKPLELFLDDPCIRCVFEARCSTITTGRDEVDSVVLGVAVLAKCSTLRK